MEEMHRARYVVRGVVSRLSPGTFVWSPTQKLPEPHSLGIFMEALSHRHDRSLTQFPAPLWRRGVGRTKSSKLLNIAWFFW